MITSVYEVKLISARQHGVSSATPDATYDETQGYYVGFHLLVTDGTDWICEDASPGAAVWTQDSKYDEAIKRRIIDLCDFVARYCDNPFYSLEPNRPFSYGPNMYFHGDFEYYSSNTLDFTGSIIVDGNADFEKTFFVGDTIQITGTRRNDGFYEVVNVAPTAMDVDRPFRQDVNNDDGYIFVVYYPEGLQTIAARMCEYDVYRRHGQDAYASEGVGSYSYSKNVDILGTGYPVEVVSGLSGYKRPRFR